MAIAGLVIMGVADRMDQVRAALQATPGIVDVQATQDSARLAAVLEAGADRVEAVMAALLEHEGVLTVDLAYLSYEDDLAAGGEIPCPPHKPKKKRDGVA